MTERTLRGKAARTAAPGATATAGPGATATAGPGATATAGPGATARAPGEVLAIVSAGVVLASLDLFVVNVALPPIARDLGTANLSELSWVRNGYGIVYAALVVGGLLVTASWRWVFLINVPIGAVALVAGWRRLPHIPGHRGERPDPLGVILVTGGVAALTFGLVKGSDWGWGSASVDGTLAAAAVLIVFFVVHSLRSGNPLIHPSLFRSRSFTGAALG